MATNSSKADMSPDFHYSTKYTLDKTHYEECYQASMPTKKSPKAYIKSVVFIVFGVIFLLMKQSPYLTFFFIGLGIIEALQVKFHKTWYLMRQMVSKAAGNPVTLTLNEKGIRSQSDFVNQSILWTEIDDIQVTEQGFLIAVKKRKSYISKRCLDDDAIAYIQAHMPNQA
jgi:hypothetical protein